jgi:hypothetical protein
VRGSGGVVRKHPWLWAGALRLATSTQGPGLLSHAERGSSRIGKAGLFGKPSGNPLLALLGPGFFQVRAGCTSLETWGGERDGGGSWS